MTAWTTTSPHSCLALACRAPGPRPLGQAQPRTSAARPLPSRSLATLEALPQPLVSRRRGLLALQPLPRGPLCSVHGDHVAWLQHAACPQLLPCCPAHWADWAVPLPSPELAPGSHLLSGGPVSRVPCFTLFSLALTPNHLLSFWSPPLPCLGFADWHHHPGVVPIATCCTAMVRALQESKMGRLLPQRQLAVASPSPPGPPCLTACPVNLTNPGRCHHRAHSFSQPDTDLFFK